MIKRITLENYMSHTRTVIEPAAGLTVLVGPNNCGKSAIISALQTLCGDNEGDYMVRHGEKNCTVTVETDDNHVITWRRIKGKVSYVLDGVEVHRAGRGNLPDNLQEFLRLSKVQPLNSDAEFDVHFGLQKSPIFLIDKETQAAQFFSSASDAEKLLEIQRLHRDKTTAAKRELKTTTAELQRLDAELLALAPMDALQPQLDQLQLQHDALIQHAARIESLRLLIQQIEKQNVLVSFHLAQTAATLELQSPPVLQDENALAKTITQLKLIADKQSQISVIRQTLAPLTEPPPQHDTAGLVRLLAGCESAGLQSRQSTARLLAMQHLQEPPVPVDPEPLIQMGKRLAAAHTTITACAKSIESILTESGAMEAQINNWLAANPQCPTCGGPTSRQHLLTAEAAHAG